VVAEVLLRCVSSPNPPPLPHVQRDHGGGIVLTTREIEEGIAVAHFSQAGARLTGNPPIPGGPAAVIVGDSYVVAQAVADRETMGAQLERIARDASVPLNVRQYGWSGASPAQYLLSAREIRARWSAAPVIIELSDNDLDFNTLTVASPRVRVLPNGRLRVIGKSASLAPEPQHHSALVELARHRWYDLRLRAPNWVRRFDVARATIPAPVSESPPDSLELASLPSAVVRALAQAYGDNLSLIYLAEVRLAGDDSSSDIERRFLDACRREAVRCASTRSAMLVARRSGVITRGTSTNAIGNGHLNAAGHAVVASVIWPLVREQVVARRHGDAE
jgi:hypothetical protein